MPDLDWEKTAALVNVLLVTLFTVAYLKDEMQQQDLKFYEIE